MIKILHVIHSMNRAGAETTIMNIFRLIDRSKVTFDFLLEEKENDYEAEIKSLGGRIYRMPNRKEGVFKQIKALDQFFGEHVEYKIIHYHVSSLTNIEVLKSAYRHNVPVRIIHSRNTAEGGSNIGVLIHKCLHYWNQRHIKKYATNYFACSDLAAKWLYGENQYNVGEYNIINNGIMTDKFIYNSSVRNEVRKEFNIGDNLLIGNVARFHPQKNHMYLLKIFKDLHIKNPKSILMLIGDGDYRKEIENEIKKLGLENSVILTGVRSDVNRILQGLDIFLLPSLFEGLPGTVVEAQGAGLPCFISDTITKTVGITKLVHFMDIDEPVETWSTKMLKVTNGFIRKNTKQELINAGFDMKIVTEKLQKFYLQKMNIYEKGNLL